jgi:hypothetical protein
MVPKILLPEVRNSNFNSTWKERNEVSWQQASTCTNLAKVEQIWSSLAFKFVPERLRRNHEEMTKVWKLLDFLDRCGAWHHRCSITGTSEPMKGVYHANVDRDDVQKGPGAKDQAKGMYLQALRRPYLLAEFSETSSRSS